MKRRTVLGTALLAALGCAKSERADRAGIVRGKRRLLSLSPAITETLFAIGAGPDVVGVSDYCNYPEAAKRLPRAGSALTPGYEAIVRLAPTLILCEAAASVPRRELSALGVTKFLAWLSLEDIVASTRLLGALSGHATAADQLARQLWDGLAIAEAPSGPHVLLVLGENPGRLSEIYFVKRNSIHGAALRAAGARNAVDSDVAGVPRLSLEQLLQLDPDAIIVLIVPQALGSKRAEVLSEYATLEPLTAPKNGRVSVLEAEEAFGDGPRILTLAARLRKELARLFPN